MTFECPSCRAVGNVSPVEASMEFRCPACANVCEFRPESIESGGLRACPVCATEDLYVQKDFPQSLGLAIVIGGFIVSTYFWYYDRPVPALSILLVSALVDMALFYIVPDVTICYRCLSQCRGDGSNLGGRFPRFDIAVGERYRQERMRVEQLRGKSAPPAP